MQSSLLVFLYHNFSIVEYIQQPCIAAAQTKALIHNNQCFRNRRGLACVTSLYLLGLQLIKRRYYIENEEHCAMLTLRPFFACCCPCSAKWNSPFQTLWRAPTRLNWYYGNIDHKEVVRGMKSVIKPPTREGTCFSLRQLAEARRLRRKSETG